MPPVRKHRNYKKRINYIIAVCVLVLFYTWLGRYAYSPKGGGISDVHGRKPGSVAIGGGNISPVTDRTYGLAAELPDDIPVFVPSRVLTCHIADDRKAASAVLETAEPIEHVIRFYQSALAQKGWVIESRQEETGGLTRLFRCEKHNRRLLVHLTGGADGTGVRLKYTSRPGD